MSSQANKNLSDVQYLPCDIDYVGSTDINAYFKVTTSADGGLRSQIRGHELIGEKMHISSPELPVTGLLVTRGTRVGGEGTRLEVTGAFDSITVWQHDAKPDIQQIRDYIEWFEIANAVHS